MGQRLVTPLKTKEFGRIAAQTAKHVLRQGIREAERGQQLSEIQSRAHDIVQATVTRVDPEKGIVALDLSLIHISGWGLTPTRTMKSAYFLRSSSKFFTAKPSCGVKHPVSYTHLGYGAAFSEKGKAARNRSIPGCFGCRWWGSVSYTHLDVYKRQIQRTVGRETSGGFLCLWTRQTKDRKRVV